MHTLTLAGAPIDFHAGDVGDRRRRPGCSPARSGSRPTGRSSRRRRRRCPGRAVLGELHRDPAADRARRASCELLAHIDDDAHVARYRGFEDWFKHTQDIPGAFYLWLVEHLFRATS